MFASTTAKGKKPAQTSPKQQKPKQQQKTVQPQGSFLTAEKLFPILAASVGTYAAYKLLFEDDKEDNKYYSPSGR